LAANRTEYTQPRSWIVLPSLRTLAPIVVWGRGNPFGGFKSSARALSVRTSLSLLVVARFRNKKIMKKLEKSLELATRYIG